MIDSLAYRKTLGQFATGVIVVTTSIEGAYLGVTVNSFTSVSLDPPLVLFCLDKKAQTAQSFLDAHHFAFNILSEAQEEISNYFARSNKKDFSNIPFDLCEGNTPMLRETLGVIQCKKHDVFDGGDHHIIIGEVIKLSYDEENVKKPLLYYSGKYNKILTI